ncbi:phage holin family protein [Nodosilinea nodulosa]|uniref:phage holin family protein n=1 Tax=Nodosilinea nodulosa TaxID=416001 RepID=UPI00037E07FA|nr:phage holin family protein [Nodosilinea nodulosa]
MTSSTSTWDHIEDYLRRVLRLGTVLIDTHLDMAVQEANYESRRLIGGVIMLGIGIGLLTTVGVLAQIMGVLFAYDQGLSWLEAVGAVAGVNLLLGIVLLVAGRLRLRGPVMTQTQARLARSMALLKAKE